MLYLGQSELDSILNIMDYSPGVETDSVNIINFVQCLCAYIAFPYRFGAINEPWILNPGARLTTELIIDSIDFVLLINSFAGNTNLMPGVVVTNFLDYNIFNL